MAASIFPAVAMMSGDYELGQISKLYFSMMWLMSPLIFFGAYIDMRRQAVVLVKKCRERKILSLFFFGMLSPAMFFVALLVNFESKDLNDFRVAMMFHSRWGMPIWGFIQPAGAAVMCAMIFFWMKNVVCDFD